MNFERVDIIENFKERFSEIFENISGNHTYYIDINESEITHIWLDVDLNFVVQTISYNKTEFIGRAIYLEGIGWKEIKYTQWIVIDEI